MALLILALRQAGVNHLRRVGVHSWHLRHHLEDGSLGREASLDLAPGADLLLFCV